MKFFKKIFDPFFSFYILLCFEDLSGIATNHKNLKEGSSSEFSDFFIKLAKKFSKNFAIPEHKNITTPDTVSQFTKQCHFVSYGSFLEIFLRI